MGSRHHLAIKVIHEETQDIASLASYLLFAVNECNNLKQQIETDPAVLLLASQLALVTGTDTPVRMRYQEMYDVCVREMSNDLATVQTPTNLN
jgi:hypothetical protein